MDAVAHVGAVEAAGTDPISRDHSHFRALEEDDRAGVLKNAWHIRSDKRLTLAKTDADTSGIPDPGADQAIGFIRPHDHDGLRSLQAGEGCMGGALEIHPRIDTALNQVNDDLRIRFAGKGHPVPGELPPQGQEVLDDTVVDNRDPSRAPDVRVGVAFGDTTMGRPAGVAHRDMKIVGSTLVQPAQVRIEMIEFADGASNPNDASSQDGHTR